MSESEKNVRVDAALADAANSEENKSGESTPTRNRAFQAIRHEENEERKGNMERPEEVKGEVGGTIGSSGTDKDAVLEAEAEAAMEQERQNARSHPEEEKKQGGAGILDHDEMKMAASDGKARQQARIPSNNSNKALSAGSGEQLDVDEERK